MTSISTFEPRLAVALAAGLFLLAATPAAALTKAEVFERAAPATVFIVVDVPQGIGFGSGAILSPDGLVITNHHVISGARGGRIYVFLYDPSERALDEDVGNYLKTHLHKARIATLLRDDAEDDLALLRLPPRPEGYPAVELADSDKVKVGQEVVAIGNPKGLTWTLTSGTVSAIRKKSLQTDSAINQGNSGGPLLDLSTRIIGINTYIRTDGQSLGFARPSNIVRQFVGPVPSRAPAPPPVARPLALPPSLGTPPVVAQLLTTIGELLGPQNGVDLPRLVCELLAASRVDGHAAVRGVDGTVLNNALARAIARTSSADAAARAVATVFPLAVVGADGQLWRRVGTQYVKVGPVVAWDVDDVRGTIYATNPDRKVYSLDGPNGSWRDTGLRDAVDIEASDGTLYALLRDGSLLARREGSAPVRLVPSPVQGSLLASRGVLYVLDRGQRLFRYQDGHWTPPTGPVAINVRQLAASGGAWFAIGGADRILSGSEGRVMERDAAAGIWMVGRDLLVLSKSGNLSHYEVAARKWHDTGN